MEWDLIKVKFKAFTRSTHTHSQKRMMIAMKTSKTLIKKLEKKAEEI